MKKLHRKFQNPLRILLLLAVLAQTEASSLPPRRLQDSTPTFSQAQTVTDCSSQIYGCGRCLRYQEQNVAEGTTPREYYSCSSCISGMYLKRYWEAALSIDRNICVPSCSESSHVHEHMHTRECVYLGNYCMDSQTTTSSVDQSTILSCFHTPYNNMGYVLGQRYQILNYLMSETKVEAQHTLNTVDGFKQIAQSYVPPSYEAEGKTVNDLLNEKNSVVVGQCQNEYCKMCLASNLTQCRTCWGRWGDSSRSQSCYQQFQCPGQFDGSNGCYAANFDCGSCKICEIGYSLQSSGSCYQCSQFDTNCKDCSGDSGSVQCTMCADGYGVQASDGTCKQCTTANTKRCSFDSSGTETIEMCSDTHVLNKDGNQCILECPLGQYQFSTENSYGISKIQCAQCDSSCRGCVAAGADFCNVCLGGKRLQLAANSLTRGTCVDKTQATNQHNAKIYVRSNADGAPNTSSLQYDGTVVTDLMSGIFEAYNTGATFYDVKIEVLLETGSHIITRDVVDNFESRKASVLTADFIAPSFELIIRPYKCSDNTNAGSGTYKCQQDSNTAQQNEVRILNKVGNMWHLQVPQKMTFEGIIVDSIDSNMDSVTYSNVKSQECTWTSASTPTCPTSKPFTANYQQICGYRDPLAALFEMRVNQRVASSVDQIQKLIINNSTFQNFFYEYGSFIRVPQRQAQLTNSALTQSPFNIEITGSLFRNFSNCGSILSNDNPLLTSSNDANYAYLEAVRDSIVEAIEHRYETSQVSSVAQLEQQQIKLDQNTFEAFNLLKTQGTDTKYFENKVKAEFQNYGLILQLNEFAGTLQITNNVFSKTRLQYSDICKRTSDGNSVMAFAWTDSKITAATTTPLNAILDSSTGARDKLQQQSLITLVGGTSPVTIQSNTFSDTIMTSSAVSVNTKGSLTFASNIFTNVHSYLGSAHLHASADASQTAAFSVTRNSFGFTWQGCVRSSHVTLQGVPDLNTLDILTQFYQNSSISSSNTGDRNRGGRTLQTIVQTVATAVYDQNTIESSAKVNMTGFLTAQYKNIQITTAKTAVTADTPTQAGFTLLTVDTSTSYVDSNAVLTSTYAAELSMDTVQVTVNQPILMMTSGVEKVIFNAVTVDGITVNNVLSGQPTTELAITGCQFKTLVTDMMIIAAPTTTISSTQFEAITETNGIIGGTGRSRSSAVTLTMTDTKFTNTGKPVELAQSATVNCNRCEFSAVQKIGNLNGAVSNLAIDSSTFLTTLIPFKITGWSSSSLSIMNSVFKQTSSSIEIATDQLTGHVQNCSFEQSTAPLMVTEPSNAASTNTATVKFWDSNFTSMNSSMSFTTAIQTVEVHGCIMKDSSVSQFVMQDKAASTLHFNQSQLLNLAQSMTIGGTAATFNMDTCIYTSGAAPAVISAMGSVTMNLISTNFARFTGSQLSASGTSATVSIAGSSFIDTQNVLRLAVVGGQTSLSITNNANIMSSVAQAIDIETNNHVSLTVNGLSLNGAQSSIRITGDTSQSLLNANIDSLTADASVAEPLTVSVYTGNVQIANSANLKDALVQLKMQGMASITNSNIKNLKLNGTAAFAVTMHTVTIGQELHAAEFAQVMCTSCAIPTLRTLAVGASGQTEVALTESTVGQYDFSKPFKSLTLTRPKAFSTFTLVGTNSPQTATFNGLDGTGSLKPKLVFNGYTGQTIVVDDANLNGNNRLVNVDGQALVTMKNIVAVDMKESLVSVADTTQQSTLTLNNVTVKDSNLAMPIVNFQDGTSVNMNLVKFQRINIDSQNADLCSIMHLTATGTMNINDLELSYANVINSCNLVLFKGTTVAIDTLTVQNSDYAKLFYFNDIQTVTINKGTITQVPPAAQGIVHDSPSYQDAALTLTEVSITGDDTAYTLPFTTDGGLVYFTNAKTFTATNSAFIRGRARYGAGIYLSGASGKRTTIRVTGSRFENSAADISGGAIYVTDIDSHDINMASSTFTGNSGKKYGDNIFIKQSFRTAGASAATQLPTIGPPTGGRRRLQNMVTGSDLTLNGLSFTTPTVYNQIYLENIEKSTMTMLTFNAATTNNAIEGGAIYMKNCFSTTVSSCTFTSQESLVRGGAIYMTQSESQSYMGQEDYAQSTTSFGANSFTGCKSQQGSCIYFANVRKIDFQTLNGMSNGVALKQASQTDYTAGLAADLQKTYTPITQTSLSGRGPGIFFQCHQTGLTCSFTMVDGQTFQNNQVFDVTANQNVPEDANRAIYYTGSNRPQVPTSLDYQVMQFFLPQAAGNDLILLRKLDQGTFMSRYQTEAARINWVGMHDSSDYVATKTFTDMPEFVEVNNMNTLFKTVFDNFIPFDVSKATADSTLSDQTPTLLLDNELASSQDNTVIGVVNNAELSSVGYRFQASDNMTKLVIKCAQVSNNADWNSELYPVDSSCYSYAQAPSAGGRVQIFTEQEYTSSIGLIKVPRLYLKALPGVSLKITMAVTYADIAANGEVQLTTTNSGNFYLNLKTPACSQFQIINTNLQCETCQGPDKTAPFRGPSVKDGALVVTSCVDCNDPTARFSCAQSGEKITKAGFMRIGETDAYLECPAINATSNLHTCAANDTCLEGYTGILCDACDNKYYKTLDGDCQKCDLSMQSIQGAVIQIVLAWIGFYCIAGFITRAGFSAQSKDPSRLSVFVQLMKNLVHYYLMLCLLSIIYEERWIAKKSHSVEGDIVEQYIKIIARAPFEFPIGITVRLTQCGNLGKPAQDYFRGRQQSEVISMIMGAAFLGFILLHFLVYKTCLRADDSDDLEEGVHAELKSEEMNSKRTLTNQPGSSRSVGRIHPKGSTNGKANYDTNSKFKSGNESHRASIMVENSVEQMVPARHLNNNSVQIQEQLNSQRIGSSRAAAHQSRSRESNFTGGYETPIEQQQRRNGPHQPAARQESPVSGMSRSPGRHEGGEDIELEGGNNTNEDSIYSGSKKRKGKRTNEGNKRLPPRPQNMMNSQSDLNQLNNRIAQIQYSQDGFSNQNPMSREYSDPRMRDLEERTNHSVESGDSEEEAAAHVADDEQNKMHRPSANPNRIVSRQKNSSRNNPTSLSHELKMRDKNGNDSTQMYNKYLRGRQNGPNGSALDYNNRKQTSALARVASPDAFTENNTVSRTIEYDQSRPKKGGRRGNRTNFPKQPSVNTATIDATTDNSKFGVNMLPPDTHANAQPNMTPRSKAVEVNTNKSREEENDTIVVFDRFAWCYVSIILVFGTQVLYYLWRIVDCQQLDSSVRYGTYYTNQDQLYQADRLIHGQNFSSGFLTKSFTRRDTSTECPTSVALSFQFWYAILYTIIFYWVCPVYLLKQPIFEFTVEGYAQVFRFWIVLIAVNAFSKLPIVNGAVATGFLGIHLIVYLVFLCKKLNPSEPEEDDEEKVENEGGNKLPLKQEGCWNKMTSMNVLYTGMLVVLFTSSLLGVFCILSDPNHEENDKLIKLLIMIINILFLLWWFFEFLRNMYKQTQIWCCQGHASKEMAEREHIDEYAKDVTAEENNIEAARAHSNPQPVTIIIQNGTDMNIDVQGLASVIHRRNLSGDIFHEQQLTPIVNNVPIDQRNMNMVQKYEAGLPMDEFKPKHKQLGDSDYGENGESSESEVDSGIYKSRAIHKAMEQLDRQEAQQQLAAQAAVNMGDRSRQPIGLGMNMESDISAGISDPNLHINDNGPTEQMLILNQGDLNQDYDLEVKQKLSSQLDPSVPAINVQMMEAPRQSDKVQQPSGTSTPDAITDRDNRLNSPSGVNQTGAFALQDTFSKQLPSDIVMVKESGMFAAERMTVTDAGSVRKSEIMSNAQFEPDQAAHVILPNGSPEPAIAIKSTTRDIEAFNPVAPNQESILSSIKNDKQSVRQRDSGPELQFSNSGAADEKEEQKELKVVETSGIGRKNSPLGLSRRSATQNSVVQQDPPTSFQNSRREPQSTNLMSIDRDVRKINSEFMDNVWRKQSGNSIRGQFHLPADMQSNYKSPSLKERMNQELSKIKAQHKVEQRAQKMGLDSDSAAPTKMTKELYKKKLEMIRQMKQQAKEAKEAEQQSKK